MFVPHESEYARMPKVFHLDSYESCLQQYNGTGVYCTVNFDLVSDGPSELYDMIRNYSERSETHFNHTRLSYGICLTKTCKHLYKRNTTQDLALTLEECLNETFWRDYRLKTRVTEKYMCEKLKGRIRLDTADIVVAAVILMILIFNIVGSLQDFILGTKEGNAVLTCFSIRANWRRLVAPAGEGPEPRITRLRGFYGIKAINIMLVMICHSVLPAAVDSENTRYFEEAYQTYPIMGGGTLVVQTFFVMSGFLLIYNMLIDAEKHQVTWATLPKAIVYRWLRLTPAYMVILALTATWIRHFGSGPLYQALVVEEVQSCRRDWWLHPLYANNYVDNTSCMLHTWYIAADFQLYCAGVIVYVLTKGRWRKILLGSLFIAGVVASAAHTYYRDLDGVLMLSPEASRSLMLLDPTFHHTYKRGHTNLASFVIGFAVALLVYHLQKNDAAFRKVAKYRSCFLLSVPTMLGVVLLGGVFYRDAPRAPVYVRALSGAALKPLFGAAVAVLIVGMVFKFENIYRGLVEWAGWAAPARVSYCAYALHVVYVKLVNGTRTTLVHLSFLHFLEGLSGCIFVSFLAAIPLHLLVEAPCYRLVKLCTTGKTSHDNEELEKPNNITVVSKC